MKSKFHINQVIEWDENDSMCHWIEGEREFDTREEAEVVLISLRKVAEVAGLKVSYSLAERLYLEE